MTSQHPVKSSPYEQQTTPSTADSIPQSAVQQYLHLKDSRIAAYAWLQSRRISALGCTNMNKENPCV